MGVITPASWFMPISRAAFALYTGSRRSPALSISQKSSVRNTILGTLVAPIIRSSSMSSGLVSLSMSLMLIFSPAASTILRIIGTCLTQSPHQIPE